MRTILFTLFALCLLNGNKVLAQDAPKPASELLETGYVKAIKENKAVLLMFHASWCGWCHRMDKSLNDSSVKKYFDDHFVIVHLDVYEQPEKKNLENPGAEDVLKKYNGNDKGLPYWYVFDKNAIKMADSEMPPEKPNPDKTANNNIGCPATENEVQYFLDILRKTATLSVAELESIRLVFRKNDSEH